MKATLYPGRVEQVAALLDHEKSHAHVEAVVRPGNDGVLAALPEDADWDTITAGIKTHSWERARFDIKIAEAKIKNITEKAEKLKKQIADCKAFAESIKESNERRQKRLAAQRTEAAEPDSRALESVQFATRKARHRLDKVHKRTVEAREHLCREASSLSGLKRIKNSEGRTEYHLDGLILPGLRDLNGINGKIKVDTIESASGDRRVSEPHEIISASFDNICRFLGICCHYLSIRLPAEIILPHGDFPHAAVLPRDSSYRTTNVRYPGTGSQTASPAASRILQRNDFSRPRLLRLDRPLPQLQKEDPKSALFFLEGVTSLAYDIAWLCKSQGVESINSFADISPIGHNLYHLFHSKDIRNQAEPALNRNISAATTKTDRSPAATPDNKPQLGLYSHNSTQHSLVSYSGFMLFTPEAWPVSMTRLIDHLKSHLRQETQRAEWHFVDDTEWDEDREDERPVLIGGARRPQGGPDPAMSVLSVKPSDGTDEADLPIRDRGATGWMKVRGRGSEE